MSKRHYGSKTNLNNKNKLNNNKLKDFDVEVSATKLIEENKPKNSTAKMPKATFKKGKLKSFGKVSNKKSGSPQHKLVQFNTSVDIFEISDNWKVKSRNENLKTENEQQARNKKLKEIYLTSDGGVQKKCAQLA